MSWDQGIQVREELPENFINWAEAQFLKIKGYRARVQYITWFGLGHEIILDFGIENPSMTYSVPGGLYDKRKSNNAEPTT